MNGLDYIRFYNDQAVAKAASPAIHGRDCSFHVTRAGLILHSALHRNTLFVGRDTRDFAPLHHELTRGSKLYHNRLIEAYFSDETDSVEAAIALARG